MGLGWGLGLQGVSCADDVCGVGCFLAVPRSAVLLASRNSAENTPTSRPVKDDSLVKVRYGIIGAGAVSDFHHVPGIDLDPRAKLVMVADPVQA